MTISRRDFIRRSGCALGSAALISGLDTLGLINAFAQSSPSDYRALVCILLLGGNDGSNMVIPYDDYSAYSRVRTPTSGLAILKPDLLQIAPPSQQGRVFGFHPSMPELKGLFDQKQLAVLCNVGTLIQPVTRAQYLSRSVSLPNQLFSHLDQRFQQETSVSNAWSDTGWGGRIADIMAGINGTAAATLPMAISTAGTEIFVTGKNRNPLTVDSAPAPINRIFVLNSSCSPVETQARRTAFDQIRGSSNITMGSAYNNVTSEALLAGTLLSKGPDPTLATTFPNTSLGNQLKQIAKLIKANLTFPSLGLRRQIFICALRDFDTHSDQLIRQKSLLRELSQCMKSFYDATIELSVVLQVTTFTLSDFGRAFQPSSINGRIGSDHGWGNHQLIMGGAVRGGDFYGTFQTLALAGPDDTDTKGRWIPTTSVEQYAATLASWYGLSSTDIPMVFPFIGRFATPNLGFMT